MKLSPDFEKAFQEYQEGIDRGFSPRKVLATSILGDENYTRTISLRGYNGDVDMLREPRVAVRRANQWGIPTSKHAHRLRADHFEEIAAAMETEYKATINAALDCYGEGNGRLISGVIRDHFPDGVKNRLRFLAHGLPMVKDAVRLHRYLAKTRSPLFHE